MSLLLFEGNNCFTAPLEINKKCVSTVSSWEKSILPTIPSLLHDHDVRIPLHTFPAQNRTEIYDITLTWVSHDEEQYVQLASANGTIDIEAITPFIAEILQEKKDIIYNIYSILYESE
jgi:hypothetical protein|tara:strand:- start:1116 stop:1469 length:354 start_codon:yes stop_codon:yes gene_type:complete